MTWMGPDSQSKDPRPAGVLDRGTLVIIMQILTLVRKESGLAKRIRLLWSGIYWVSPRLEGMEVYAELMAAKGYVLGIKTKINWSGKYYS